MTDPKVNVVLAVNASLGEGPHYDPTANELIWVDIDGMSINFLQLSDGNHTNRKLQLSDKPSIAIPCTSDANKLLVLLGRKICLLDRNTGEVLKELCSVEHDEDQNRFNDGKCDSQGRLWCGTLCVPTDGQFRVKGSLYSFDGVTIKHHLSDIGISNGIEWSLDDSIMYYIDSIPKRKVYSFSYDKVTGGLSDQKVAVDFSLDDARGLPDGMCRDNEGKLWIAAPMAGVVGRWDPVTGDKLTEVAVPVKKPTSCCFGGPDYDVLYVTSGVMGAGPEELAECPHSGDVFAITGLGVKGLPANTFDDSKCY
jgi:sugar lactone lactonase YvrE